MIIGNDLLLLIVADVKVILFQLNYKISQTVCRISSYVRAKSPHPEITK